MIEGEERVKKKEQRTENFYHMTGRRGIERKKMRDERKMEEARKSIHDRYSFWSHALARERKRGVEKEHTRRKFFSITCAQERKRT